MVLSNWSRKGADFEVANTSILGNITRIMSLGSSIRAELCMLNVYSTGGYFQSSIDSPHSKDVFGSLVVCLPSQFTGGELVTRHQGRQVIFDWSSSATTHWAAFLSDVEHEVLPVTSGHRITLVYNLYRYDRISSFDATTSPLYQELLLSLKHPQDWWYIGLLVSAQVPRHLDR